MPMHVPSTFLTVISGGSNIKNNTETFYLLPKMQLLVTLYTIKMNF